MLIIAVDNEDKDSLFSDEKKAMNACCLKKYCIFAPLFKMTFRDGREDGC